MNKIDWTKWSAIAEILSALAIVVTLLYLGLQTRYVAEQTEQLREQTVLNTTMTRVSVYDELMREITQLESGRVYDPEAARILSTFYQETTATLEETERLTVSSYVGVLYRIYERAYFTREYEIIGDDEWSRFEFLICENLRRARLMGEELTEHQYLTSAFREYMKASCA